MKKIALLTLVFLLVGSPVLYAANGQKGASQKAYEHASDEAVFNRVGDWFATIGKSEEEKTKIIAERKAKRAQKRAEQEAKKAKKMAGKEMNKAKKKTEKMKGSTHDKGSKMSN